jgi:hypothetical protein
MGKCSPVTVARRVLVVEAEALCSIEGYIPIGMFWIFFSLAFWQTAERISAALSASQLQSKDYAHHNKPDCP